MFRKCDNIFLLCNVTHLRLGLGKLFMLGIHETWTFFPPNQKELKTKIEPAFSLILYLCSFLFMIQYDGRKMDRHFEKKLIWELLKYFKNFVRYSHLIIILLLQIVFQNSKIVPRNRQTKDTVEFVFVKLLQANYFR